MIAGVKEAVFPAERRDVPVPQADHVVLSEEAIEINREAEGTRGERPVHVDLNAVGQHQADALPEASVEPGTNLTRTAVRTEILECTNRRVVRTRRHQDIDVTERPP